MTINGGNNSNINPNKNIIKEKSDNLSDDINSTQNLTKPTTQPYIPSKKSTNSHNEQKNLFNRKTSTQKNISKTDSEQLDTQSLSKNVTNLKARSIILDNFQELLSAAENSHKLKNNFPVKVHYIKKVWDASLKKHKEIKIQLLPQNNSTNLLPVEDRPRIKSALIYTLKKYKEVNGKDIESLKKEIQKREMQLKELTEAIKTQQDNPSHKPATVSRIHFTIPQKDKSPISNHEESLEAVIDVPQKHVPENPPINKDIIQPSETLKQPAVSTPKPIIQKEIDDSEPLPPVPKSTPPKMASTNKSNNLGDVSYEIINQANVSTKEEDKAESDEINSPSAYLPQKPPQMRFTPPPPVKKKADYLKDLKSSSIYDDTSEYEYESESESEPENKSSSASKTLATNALGTQDQHIPVAPQTPDRMPASPQNTEQQYKTPPAAKKFNDDLKKSDTLGTDSDLSDSESEYSAVNKGPLDIQKDTSVHKPVYNSNRPPPPNRTKPPVQSEESLKNQRASSAAPKDLQFNTNTQQRVQIHTQDICSALSNVKTESEHGNIVLISGPSSMKSFSLHPQTALDALSKGLKHLPNQQEINLATLVKQQHPNCSEDETIRLDIPQPNSLNIKALLITPIEKSTLTNERLALKYNQATDLLPKRDQYGELFILPLATGRAKDSESFQPVNVLSKKLAEIQRREKIKTTHVICQQGSPVSQQLQQMLHSNQRKNTPEPAPPQRKEQVRPPSPSSANKNSKTHETVNNVDNIPYSTNDKVMLEAAGGGGHGIMLQKSDLQTALSNAQTAPNNGNCLILSGPPKLKPLQIQDNTALKALSDNLLDKKTNQRLSLSQLINKQYPNIKDGETVQVKIPEPNTLNLKYLILTPIDTQSLSDNSLSNSYDDALAKIPKASDYNDLFIIPMGTGRALENNAIQPINIFADKIHDMFTNNKYISYNQRPFIPCHPSSPLSKNIQQILKGPKYNYTEATMGKGGRAGRQYADPSLEKDNPKVIANSILPNNNDSNNLPIPPTFVSGFENNYGVERCYVNNFSSDSVTLRKNQLIYDKTNPGGGMNMGSVNAGASYSSWDGGSGYVDGGGINSAFRTNLRECGQKTDAYQQFHYNKLENANRNELSHDSNVQDHPDVESCTFFHERSGTPTNDPVGSVIIDTFKDEKCPNKNTENKAMIYVYPPNPGKYTTEYGGETAFKEAVKRTARNLILTVEEHNKSAAPKNQIQVVRMCGFSSGIYGGRTAMTISLIHQGIEEGLKMTSKNRTIKVIQYPHDMDILHERTNRSKQKETPKWYNT